MLILACLLAPLLIFVLARQRAQIIRLRVERRLPPLARGSWSAFLAASASRGEGWREPRQPLG